MPDVQQLPLEWVETPPAMSAEEARRYCARLARSHYENFHVVTFLLPARLRQDFYNVYAYCRWADDLGDEAGDTGRATRLLERWRKQLAECYSAIGNAQSAIGLHPVFVALADTIRRHEIPPEPFHDLITAFLQDQQVTRYPTYGDLLGYCRYSANPVGRLVLYLCGYRDAERQQLSDFTCTALQLANFWQDVRVDLEKGRIYIPLEDIERFGYSEEALHRLEFTPEFRALMRFEVERARDLFRAGLPLAGLVDARLAGDIELFSRGGLGILRRIEQCGYDVLSARPALTGRDKLRLLAGAVARRLFGVGATPRGRPAGNGPTGAGRPVAAATVAPKHQDRTGGGAQ
jgi:squalene synthase HpnC